MKNSMKNQFVAFFKKGLTIFLSLVIIVTSINISEFKSIAAAPEGGTGESNAYSCTSTDIVSSIKSSGLTLADGKPFDPSKEYEVGQNFTTKLDFTISSSLIDSVRTDPNIPSTQDVYFVYNLPDNIDTGSAMGTTGEILGSADNGTYKIADHKVYFMIKKAYFETHTDGIGVEFTYTFEADEDKIVDGVGSQIAFEGTGTSVTVKSEKPGAGGYKNSGSAVTGADGNLYIPYSINMTTKSRKSSEVVITDTLGSNIQVDLNDPNSDFTVTYKGAPLRSDQYEVVANDTAAGGGFSIKINEGKLGAKIDAKADIQVSYKAKVSDTKLDSNGDGLIDGTDNKVTWTVDGNAPSWSPNTNPQVDVVGNFKMNKSSSVDNNAKTINWDVALNTSSIPADMSGYKYEDTISFPAGVTAEFGNVVIKDASGKIVDTITASTLAAANGNFSYVFPANAGTQKYTISYSTKVTSDLANGESVEIDNTGIVKDKENKEVGKDTEKAKITKNLSLGITKEAVGDLSADYTMGWKSVITPDVSEGLTNLFFHDSLSESYAGYYGSTFVEDSLVIEAAGSVLVKGTDYDVTFTKSDKAVAAGADGNDVMEIRLKNNVGYTSKQPITITYKSKDDGSGLDGGKNLLNKCYVNDPQFNAEASKYVSKSDIKKSIGKNGQFTPDGKNVEWNIYVNGLFNYDREGIRDIANKDIRVEDIIPKGAELDLNSINVNLVYAGAPDYNGYAVKGFSKNYDASTRKMTLNIPYSAVKEASSSVASNYILQISYKTAVNTYLPLKNDATWYASGEKQDETDTTVTNPTGSLLNKTAVDPKADGKDTQIAYKVEVNPTAYDYFKAKDSFDLRDDLPAGNVVSGSITIKDSLGNDLLASNKASYSYKPIEKQLFFTVPDSTHVFIEYKFTPDLSGCTKNADGTYNISAYNTIKCISGEDGESSGKGITGKMSSSAATMKGTSLVINKVDASNLGKKLGGAAFELKRYNATNGTFENIVEGNGITVSGVNYTTDTASSFTTNETSGIITYANLTKNTIYSFKEVAAPSGYVVDNTEYYIIIVDTVASANDAKNALASLKEKKGIDSDKVMDLSNDNNVLITNTTSNKTTTNIKKVDNAEKYLKGASLELYTTEEGTATDFDAQIGDSYYKRKDLVTDCSWISGTDVHTIEDLTAGEVYILHEASAPDGYQFAKDVAFTVLPVGSVTEVTMVDTPTSIEAKKLEKEADGTPTSNYVLGSTIQIIDKSTGKVVDSWITDKAAHNITGKLSAGKTYVLRETDVPAGYKKADDIEFKVSEDGATYESISPATGSITELVMYDVKTTTTKVSKFDADGTTLLSGAKLQILDSSKDIVYLDGYYEAGKNYWTSDGTVKVIEGLPSGTYYLHEVEAPEGYETAADKMFTVKVDGTVTEVTMTDLLIKPATLKVSKTDGSNPLSGAKLQLLDESKKVVELSIYDKGKSYWTSDGTVKVITDLKAGTYYIHEVEAPIGYKLPATDIKVVLEAGKTSEETVVNTKINTSLTINKVDEKGAGLADATIKIYKAVLDQYGNVKKTGTDPITYEKGELVATWTSTVSGNTWTSEANPQILADVTYIVTEESAPSGYTKANEMLVKLKEGSNNITVVNSKDSDKSFAVLKVDTNGTAVAGAKLAIYKAILSGSEFVKGEKQSVAINDSTTSVDSWTTELAAVTINGLSSGDYYLVEEEAPAGKNLEVASPILFTYDSTTGQVTTYQGTKKITKVTENETQIKMVDNYKPFHLEKRETGKTTPLAGATLEIYKSGDMSSPIKTLNASNATDVDGVWDISEIDEGKYVLREKSAPEGYAKSVDIAFTVNNNMTLSYTYKGVNYSGVTSMVMEDDKLSFSVAKVDVNGNAVVGAKLQILNASTNAVVALAEYDSSAEYWTTNTVAKKISALAPGDYLLREYEAPSQYKKSEDITFTLKDDGTVSYSYDGSTYNNMVTITMVDEPNSLILYKVDGSNQPLNGAVFHVYKTSDGSDITVKDPVSGTTKNISKGVMVDSTDLVPSDGSGVALPMTSQETGYYLLVEDTVPSGYIKADPIYFYYDNATGKATYYIGNTKYKNTSSIVVKNIATELVVQKYDEYNKPLKGAQFEIYADKYDGSAEPEHGIYGAKLESFVSADTPTVIKALTVGKWYILKEVKAPDGYTLAGNVAFKINENGTVNYGTVGATPTSLTDEINDSASIIVKDTKTSIKIAKKAINTSGSDLSGATLVIKDGGKIVKTLEMTGSEMTVEGLILDKEYTLSETKVPDGYKKSMDIKFKIDSATGKIVLVDTYTYSDAGTNYNLSGDDMGEKLIMVDEPIVKLTLKKVTSNGAGLAGAEFDIYEAKESDIDVTSGLKNSNGTDCKFVDGSKWYYVSDDQVRVAVYTSDGNAKVFSSENEDWLKANTKYIIVETKAPTGYKVMKPVLITTDAAPSNTDIKLINEEEEVKNTNIRISKLTPNKEGLAGARLELYKLVKDSDSYKKDADGIPVKADTTAIDAWTSEVTPHILIGTSDKWIEGDWYLLHEVSAPYGYALASDVAFKILPKGEITYVNMEDPKASLASIYFSKIVNDVEVSGAEFELTTKDDTVNFMNSSIVITGGSYSGKTATKISWTSGTSAVSISGLPDAQYILTEKKAPAGCVSDANGETITFTVKEGKILSIPVPEIGDHLIGSTAAYTADNKNEVKVVNQKDTVAAKLEISKIVADEIIAGAKFELTSEHNSVNFSDSDITISGSGTDLSRSSSKVSWTSGADAQVFDGLPNGKYILYELKAPAGCEDAAIGANVAFVINDTKIISSTNNDLYQVSATYDATKLTNIIKVVNKPKQNLVKLSKLTVGHILPGAEMELTCTDPSVDMQYVTCLGGASDFVHTATKCTWTSSSTKIILSDLEDNEYILTETKAPAGYLEAAPIKFTTQGGNIKSINGKPVDQYNCDMVDLVDPAEVTIAFAKVKENDHLVFLKGAKFELFKDSACTISLGTAVSNDYGIVKFPSVTELGELYIKEISAPDGYKLSTEVYTVEVIKTYTGREVIYKSGFIAKVGSEAYNKVENEPKEPNNTKKPEDDTTVNKKIEKVDNKISEEVLLSGGAPQTSDDAHPGLWLSMMLSGLLMICTSMMALRKKRR